MTRFDKLYKEDIFALPAYTSAEIVPSAHAEEQLDML